MGPIIMEKRMGLRGQPWGIPSVDSTTTGFVDGRSQKRRESKAKACWKKRKRDGWMWGDWRRKLRVSDRSIEGNAAWMSS